MATTDAGGSSSNSEAASPTASSASSLQGLPTGGGSAAYPRIASMPNLHLRCAALPALLPAVTGIRLGCLVLPQPHACQAPYSYLSHRSHRSHAALPCPLPPHPPHAA